MTAAQSLKPETESRIVLRVEGLGKTYGGVVALSDVDLSIRAGTIHGLLGENGVPAPSISTKNPCRRSTCGRWRRPASSW